MSCSIHFRITRWAAWAPTCWTSEHWKEWAKGELLLKETQNAPKVKIIPAMIRRRLSRLSKMALQVTIEVLQNESVDFIVFCSRHGELHRTVKILLDISEGELPSPTAFSQSVHNTSAGLYGIISKDKSVNTAISSYGDSLETALVIAWARLSQPGTQQCLVVYADEILPDIFESYREPNEITCSAAFLLSAFESQNAGTPITLKLNGTCEPSPDIEHSCLSLLRSLQTPVPVEFTTSSSQHIWQWKIHNVQG